MKSIKTIIGISLATAGLAGGAALGIASANRFQAFDVKATAPTNTRRIWIINNDNWWTDNNYWVYAWNDNGSYGSAATTKVNMVLTDYYHGLGYADITLADATTDLNVRIVNSWGDYGQTKALSLPEFGGEDVIWMNSGEEWDSSEERHDRPASLGITTGFSAVQLHYIFTNGHYNTCSANNTNGYNSYPQMNKNFFEPTDVDLKGEIVSGTYSVQDYIDGMQERYVANN